MDNSSWTNGVPILTVLLSRCKLYWGHFCSEISLTVKKYFNHWNHVDVQTSSTITSPQNTQEEIEQNIEELHGCHKRLRQRGRFVKNPPTATPMTPLPQPKRKWHYRRVVSEERTALVLRGRTVQSASALNERPEDQEYV